MLSRNEKVAKRIVLTLYIAALGFLLGVLTGEFILMILGLVLWSFLAGMWALFTGCLYVVRGSFSTGEFAHGKTAKFLGIILLLIPFYFLVRILFN